MIQTPNPFAPAPVPRETACKVCGSVSRLVAVMDAARSAVDARAGRAIEPLSGQAVYFHRCGGCGFTFTRSFDHWTHADFAREVYNLDYARHDPAYADGERGRRTAADLIGPFGAWAGELEVLDWGSGEGSFASAMRAHGFARVDCHDPFVAATAGRPLGRYAMVTCFEVIEHVLDPLALVQDLADCRASDGAILISTLLCSPQVVDFGLENWHYAVPRNGHVSLLSAAALAICARQAGLQAHAFTERAHVLFDPSQVPAWLRAALPQP